MLKSANIDELNLVQVFQIHHFTRIKKHLLSRIFLNKFYVCLIVLLVGKIADLLYLHIK